MKPIKLSELIEALELDFPETVTRIDLEEGCVVTVEKSLLGALEEGDEEILNDLPDWQKREGEIARAIAQDPGERFVEGPSKFDFHEYRQMELFIQTVRNPEVADQLWRAIKGKGAFRYFKDTASRLGLLDQWFRYRDDALKEFVLDWAKDNDIPVEDDTNR